MYIWRCFRGHTRGEADFEAPVGDEVLCQPCIDRGWPRGFMYKIELGARCEEDDEHKAIPVLEYQV